MTSDSLNNPIRVLHIIDTLGTGGMENGVVNLVNRHNPNSVSADVLCTRSLGHFASRIPADRIHYSSQKRSGLFSETAIVAQTCKQTNCDVVHSHSWATLVPAFLGARFARVPVFVHGEHGTLFLDTAKRRLMQRIFFNRANRCLAVSSSLAQEIVSTLRLQENHFTVIPNGVDIAKFHPNSESKRNLCRLIGANSGAMIIGSVGRLVDVKDYPTLLRAFSLLLRATAFDSHLVLVGDGPARALLESLANELRVSRRVHFFGHSNSVAEIIPGFDIFALPSLHEGMSNTLLEAVACGVFFVASDIPATHEIIQRTKTGIVFEPGNAEALCNCLSDCLARLAAGNALTPDNQASIRGEISIEKMVRDYEELYRSLIRRTLTPNH